MSVILIEKQNKRPYYIKEADINIYNIYELEYFIYNYASVISNNFISKALITYINNVLKLKDLSESLSNMRNSGNGSLLDMLTLILEVTDYYSQIQIRDFRRDIKELTRLSKEDYIFNIADKLCELKKYDKAIIQYKKLEKDNIYAKFKLGKCFARLQLYDEAINYFHKVYLENKSEIALKNIFYCLKLSGRPQDLYTYEAEISEDTIVDWEYDIVKLIIEVKNSEEVKEKDEIFLMGDQYIRKNLQSIVKVLKDKYRYIG